MTSQLPTQILGYWNRLTVVQRMLLVALVLAAAILIPVLVNWAGTPTYSVAFSNLSEADAGAIVEQLVEAGVDYELPRSGTIAVPAEQVYEVRMQMAREGLPEGGTVGYELFSGNTLGMTEFTQRINYQRALEGELERTISNLDAIEAVRVHIVTPEKRLLASDQAPATASVTVKVRSGQQIDAAQVRSITHLVASSVEDLKPENVVVVDVNGMMLSAGVEDGYTTTGQTDQRQALEQSAAAEIRHKVQSLLDSSLGPNRSVVQAYVTMDWTERKTTVQSFEPDPQAVRSSQVISETYATDGTLLGGIPGSDNNLPPVVEEDATGDQATSYQRLEKTLNYELTQSETQEVFAPGIIERVSLSVLVDGVQDQAQLATLKSVIAAAAGIDETRGDLLAVETLEFDHSYYETQVAEFESQSQTDQYFRYGQVAAAVLILLFLFFYMQRQIGNLRRRTTREWVPIMKPVSELALSGSSGGYALPGKNYPGLPQRAYSEASTLPEKSQAQSREEKAARMEAAAHEQQIEKEIHEIEAKAQPINPQDERLVKLVSHMAEEDPSRVAEVIQMWLSEGKR